jgi:hypothetical protein
MSTSEPTTQQPPTINFILSFLLVGLAWGFTTPFIRRAVKDRAAAAAADAAASSTSSAKRHDEADNKANLTLPKRVRGLIANGLAAAIDLLRNPRYAIPLVLNLSGSVWFFLLVGKAGMFPPRITRSILSPFQPPGGD